MLKIDNRQS